ncbi:hypothetical protein [Brevibacillus centrosporus]|uniref:hypothetical protein n=1 Tax=Brevibacillus centrosporus TaxID=54910 RepID=UPI003B01AD3F
MSNAEADPKKEAEASVDHIIDLLANKHFEEAAALVEDPKFKTKKEQAEAYQENESSDEMIDNYRILSAIVINDHQVDVKIELFNEAVGTQ